MKIRNALATAVLLASPSLHAATVTYSGLDLLSVASFPSVTPIVNGSSLLFDTAQQQHLKLFVLPLGSLPEGKVKVLLDLTRPACEGSCVGGAEDFDPNIALSNGSAMVGIIMADNDGGQALQSSFADQGTFAYRLPPHGALFGNAGYPQIGQSVVVAIEFTLGAGGTVVNAGYLNGAGSYTGPALAAAGHYELVFMRDNDAGERYQVNSVTVIAGPDTKPVAIDVKPGSCENPFNVTDTGVTPVVIPGTAGLDVTQVDPATLRLNGVPAAMWSYEDVTIAAADCGNKAPDGVLDLSVKFSSPALAATLAAPDRAVVDVTLTGKLLNGTGITGDDHVRVIRKR